MTECTLSNSKRISGLHFTTKHTGKMAGMASISTAVTTNERCAKNAQIPDNERWYEIPFAFDPEV